MHGSYWVDVKTRCVDASEVTRIVCIPLPYTETGFPELKTDRESGQAISTKKEVIEEIKLATSLYQVRVRPASPYEASWLTDVCGEEDGRSVEWI